MIKFCFKNTGDLPEIDSDDASRNQVYGILAYCPFLVLIPLLRKQESAFVRFHVNQGCLLLLFGISIALLSGLPAIGGCIGFLGFLAYIILMSNGIRTVCGKQVKRLPQIGNYDILDFKR